MPSERKTRWHVAAWLMLPLVLQCETKDDRVDDVCNTLKLCTGYVNKGKCETQLDDAVQDGSLTPLALTRCARCLVDNNDIPTDDRVDNDGSCAETLRERDCDVACQGVSLVLNARTSPADRLGACSQLAQACGIANCDRDPLPCAETNEDRLALDLNMDACARCLAEVKPSEEVATQDTAGFPSVIPIDNLEAKLKYETGCNIDDGGRGEGTSGGAGGAVTGGAGQTGGAPSETPDCRDRSVAGEGGAGSMDGGNIDSERCQRMVELCSDVCVTIAAIDKRLILAAAATAYCDAPSDCPLVSSAADAPSGAGGDGPQPGAGGQPNDDPIRSCVSDYVQKPDCFENVIRVGGFAADDPGAAATISQQDPRECLGCLASSQCSASCPTCDVLFAPRSQQ